MNLLMDRQCLRIALRILGRRDHSTKELAAKLKDKGFACPVIEQTIGECLSLNYLDDDRYSEAYVHQLKRRGFGPLRIEQMLRSKGLPETLIAASLERHYSPADQIIECGHVLSKKLKLTARRSDPAIAKARVYRFLFSRGFSPDIIHKVLNDRLKAD